MCFGLGLAGSACTDRVLAETYDLDNPEDLERLCDRLCSLGSCMPDEIGFSRSCYENCLDDPTDWPTRPEYCYPVFDELRLCVADLTCEEFAEYDARIGRYPCFEERLALEEIHDECYKSGSEHPNSPNYEGGD